MLEGEVVLYTPDDYDPQHGEGKIPCIVINDDGERLRVKFLGPEIVGTMWVNTQQVQLCLDEGNVF
jgi:hypothetical protein